MEYEVFNSVVSAMKKTDTLYYLPQESKNALKNWMEYKFPDLTGRKYGYGDLDVSAEAIITYAIELNQYKKEYCNVREKIELQNNSFEKYRIVFEPELRGDWLTSPLHILKIYMGLLWESIHTEKKVELKEYKNLFTATTKKHLLYSPKGNWEYYIYKNVDIIWKAFHDEAKEFMQNVVKAGNFIMMPVYINPCRCKKFGDDDTFDTLMWKMFCCFQLKKDNLELEKYIKLSFSGQYEKEARENVIKWMRIFNNSWDEFVTANCLEFAVECNGKQYGRPIDFRTGKIIDIKLGEVYNPLPCNLNECIIMMRNYNECVQKRTSAIQKLIKEQNG